MFNPPNSRHNDFRDSYRKSDVYSLNDTSLSVEDGKKAKFESTVSAPSDELVWVRGWVSNAVEGTLAEAEVSGIANSEQVSLVLHVDSPSVPELACIRLESTQFATEHTPTCSALQRENVPCRRSAFRVGLCRIRKSDGRERAGGGSGRAIAGVG